MTSIRPRILRLFTIWHTLKIHQRVLDGSNKIDYTFAIGSLLSKLGGTPDKGFAWFVFHLNSDLLSWIIFWGWSFYIKMNAISLKNSNSLKNLYHLWLDSTKNLLLAEFPWISNPNPAGTISYYHKCFKINTPKD